jgi:hypothetical protein
VRTDQIIGAGVLWIGGDVAGLPFLGVLFLRWVRDDERSARAADRELDAAEDARAEAARTEAARTGPAAARTEPAASGLWWEADPEIADRFRRR